MWVKVRILHETDRALLVECGVKSWVAKSQVVNIRLKNKTFEIYIRENILN